MAISAKRKADLKVIILGDYSVGKTSLLRRYIDGRFSSIEETTVGAAFFLKQWGPYNVAVWDTAGDEKYTGLTRFYSRSAGAAILAFELTNVSSFEALWSRFSDILGAANEDCLRVVVGTKLDIVTPENRQVTSEEGRKLSREMNSHIGLEKMPHEPYFETSSLSNENITELFNFILSYCLPLSADQKKKQVKSDRSVVDLMEDSVRTEQRKKCC